jgi:hypothetical protein
VKRPFRRTVVTLLAAATASSMAVGAAATTAPEIRGPVLVSTDAYAAIQYPAGEHQAEVDIAIDPTDPQHLLIAAQEGRLFDGGSQATGTYVSFDGGATWTGSLLPGSSTATGGDYDRSTDPVAAFGPDGTAYANVFSFDRPAPNTAVLQYRSDDGGLTWKGPFVVATTNDTIKTSYDKNWMTVDANPASPFAGRIYVTWTDFRAGASGSYSGSPLYVSHSDDHGRTWSDPERLARTRYAQGSQPVVGPDGTLYVVYNELFKEIIRVTRSIDGGETFRKARVVAEAVPSVIPGVRSGDGLPNADVDPATGTLHVVWQDARFDVSDVLASRSRDGGKTWSPPLVVSDDDGAMQFTPAVAAYGGVVHVLFYDSRDDRNRSDLFTVGYARSLNGGRTFGDNLEVQDGFDIDLAADTERGRFLGDYIGLDAMGTLAHGAWVDTTAPSRYTDAAGQNDVWTARMRA